MSTYTYQPLTTEKYWLETAKEEANQIRQWQREESFKSIMTFIGVISCAAISFIAMMTSEQWLPFAMNVLRDSNVMS